MLTDQERELVRQPRVGDALETGRYGRVEVRAVRDHGVTLDVTDANGRDWTISRDRTRGHWTRVARAAEPPSLPVLTADGELDSSARYTVASYGGVAFYLTSWAERWDDEEQEWVPDGDDTVWAVMVGDDRRHLIDVEELTLLDPLGYCAECGQVGCTHDGRER
jgi:hypothetical protein